MVIALFGESCTGKSTLAALLKAALGADVYTGKDYQRLAKNETEARQKFTELLRDPAKNSVYVITEKEHLSLLPDGCLRVLVTAELPVIQQRFSARMGGKLPAPVAAMLEKKHGAFDNVPHDLHVDGTETPEAAAARILAAIDA